MKDKIINNGLAVVFNEDKLLSKVDTLSIDGEIIKSYCTLDNWIGCYDGGEFVTLVDGVQIGLDDVISTLLEKINLRIMIVVVLCQDLVQVKMRNLFST